MVTFRQESGLQWLNTPPEAYPVVLVDDDRSHKQYYVEGVLPGAPA